jgi:hypothetical protein
MRGADYYGSHPDKYSPTKKRPVSYRKRAFLAIAQNETYAGLAAAKRLFTSSQLMRLKKAAM